MSLRNSNNIKLEGGMSSMTDLVFLLLIFFIILSALSKNAVDVDLPQGGIANTEVSKTSIVIDANNAITVNGKPTSIEDAEMMILDVVDQDKVVELYADKKAEYGIAVQVIDIAKRNKLKIALMTQQ